MGRSESIVVSYLDWSWRRFMGPECFLTSLLADIRRQIDEKAPNGAFYIAGYSIGGPLAFACAHDCRAAGRKVAGVAILDAPAIAKGVPTPFLIRMRRHIKDLLKFDIRGLIGSAMAKMLTSAPMLPHLPSLAKLPAAKLPFAMGSYIGDKLAMQLTRQRYWAWWRGRIETIARSPIPTLLLSSADFDHLGQEDLGWGQYCEVLEVVHLRGSHENILDPRNLEIVQEKLGALQVEARHFAGKPPHGENASTTEP